MVIWKYPVPIQDIFKTQMPVRSQILKFTEQNGQLFMWVAVIPTNAVEERVFEIVGTGQELAMDCQHVYIDTVVMSNPELVWHLFEICPIYFAGQECLAANPH